MKYIVIFQVLISLVIYRFLWCWFAVYFHLCIYLVLIPYSSFWMKYSSKPLSQLADSQLADSQLADSQLATRRLATRRLATRRLATRRLATRNSQYSRPLLYTAKNATDLSQVVHSTSLLELVNKLQQACQFHKVVTSLLSSGLLQLVI